MKRKRLFLAAVATFADFFVEMAAVAFLATFLASTPVELTFRLLSSIVLLGLAMFFRWFL